MNTNVFNQYYFAFLRRLRDKAREKKDDDKVSRNLIRAIKNHYLNYDKDSEEYIDYYLDQFKDRVPFEGKTVAEFEKYLNTDSVQEICIYKDISLKSISKVLDNKSFTNGYFLILKIFGRKAENVLSDEDVNSIVEILKKKDEKDFNYEENVEKLTSGDGINGNGAIVKDLLTLFKLTQESTNQSIRGDFQNTFKELEDTSLGKLAKEIMEDIDLVELENSLGNSDNIFQALSNPQGGLSKLLGTVSQKMISKMASGELKQENLLQDAMKFSSKLQSGGGMGAGSPFGDISSMMGKVQEMASAFNTDSEGTGSGGGGLEGLGGPGGPGFDMSALQSMMQNMAGTMAGGHRPQSRAGAGAGAGAGGGRQIAVNNPAMDRIVKAKQLRKKLEERRKKSSTKVEELN